MSTLPANLADNMQSIRRKLRYSQAQLAQRAGIPRSTITNMESGQGNPSLENLARVAGALSIGLDELLSAPRPDCLLIHENQIEKKSRGGGRVTLWKLLPDQITGMEIDRMELLPRANMKGKPHLAGTREYLHCLQGPVQVLVSGTLYEVRAGELLAFPGNQAHAYRNPGDEPAMVISVVIPLISSIPPKLLAGK